MEPLEYPDGLDAIHPIHRRPIAGLRTVVENKREGMQDKDATSFDDLFYSIQTSLLFLHLRVENISDLSRSPISLNLDKLKYPFSNSYALL
jgi:hypothetical protein